MALPRVIHALAVKRAKLVAELTHHESRAGYCRKGIATIDDALTLWEEGKDAPILRRQHKSKPTLVSHLVRKIMSVLRETGGPLTTAQIVDSVSVGMELSKEDRHRLTINVSDRLKEMRKEGRVTAKMGPRHRNLWLLTTNI